MPENRFMLVTCCYSERFYISKMKYILNKLSKGFQFMFIIVNYSLDVIQNRYKIYLP